MSLITQPFIEILRARFRLDWHGIHGAPHWARVRANGLRLAQLTGASTNVVEYFAFMHDVCRKNDDEDPYHGLHASDFARQLHGQLVLTDKEFDELITACALHNDGYISGYSTTILTCWDADRLDLGRVFIKPNPRYLCTDAARDPQMLDWSYQRSRVKPKGKIHDDIEISH